MTRLDAISLTDVRGFYKKQKIIFAKPNGKNGSGLTVIVGPNNSGKTTVIEGFKKIFQGSPPQFDIEERHRNRNVILAIKNTAGEIKTLKTNGGSIGIIDHPEYYPQVNNFYFISSRRYFETYFDTSQLDHNQHRVNLINISKSGIDSHFGRRMIAIDADQQQKAKFNKIITVLIPNFVDWRIELSRGNNYIKYQTGKRDEHSSEFFGDGITSLFKIASALVEKNNDEILIIDEPELSLHPQAQKRFIKLLSEESADKQIIISTHSTYFVRWHDIENGAKIIRLNKPQDKQCLVNNLTLNTIDNLLRLTQDYQKPQLLDTVSKEIFFAEKVLFVEGQIDMSLIINFCHTENISLGFELFGYGSGGAGNIFYFLTMAKELGVKAGAIFDNNSTKDFNKCHESYHDDFKIEKIWKDDIIDKTNSDGLFDKNGIIKGSEKNKFINLINDFNNFFNTI